MPIIIIELTKIIEDLFYKVLNFFIEGGLLEPKKKYYSKLDFLKIAEDLSFSLKYNTLVNNGFFDREEYLNNLYFKDPLILDIIQDLIRKLTDYFIINLQKNQTMISSFAASQNICLLFL